MKQKQPFKYVIAGILALSLFSVLYVNAGSRQPFHANFTEKQQSAEVATVEGDKQERNIPVPDVTVLGRLIDLAQRLVSHTP